MIGQPIAGCSYLSIKFEYWTTGLVAKLIQLYGLLDAKRALEGGKQAAFIQGDHVAGREKR